MDGEENALQINKKQFACLHKRNKNSILKLEEIFTH